MIHILVIALVNMYTCHYIIPYQSLILYTKQVNSFALEELRRENDVLKTEISQLRTSNATMKDENKQLRTDNATMKDENKQLETENDMIKAENVQLKAHHVDTSRSLRPPLVPPKAIEHKLKVSQWSGIT